MTSEEYLARTEHFLAAAEAVCAENDRLLAEWLRPGKARLCARERSRLLFHQAACRRFLRQALTLVREMERMEEPAKKAPGGRPPC